MIRDRADIVVLGAGFAGSLMALVLRQIGREPLLVERGQHPRFAIGESSTPLANLTLEKISQTYDLPRLFPLTEYGRWQRAYPELACGLKRGFSYYQHQPGETFRPSSTHANELLVAASPADEVGDTHWFREHVDHFLVKEVRSAGIPYLDQVDITDIASNGHWHLHGHRSGKPLAIEASFLIDATGPSGVLARHLGIATEPRGIHTNSWSVYSHFEGVDLWENVLRELGGSTQDHPFRCDDAALHHVLADGWMWVLRFNNGITSAGVAFDGLRHPPDTSLPPESAWQQFLHEYPAIARQFANARAVQPWIRTGRLQRRAERAAGRNWVMLPHAAYFLDALYSGGIAHSLLGIERLARILEPPVQATRLAEQLAEYERALTEEMEFLDWLIHGSYCTFGRFELMALYTMYYFAGAVEAETRRRTGKSGGDGGFLFSQHPPFRQAVRESHDLLCALGRSAYPSGLALEFHQRVAQAIAPFNPAGFCDLTKGNMYPFVG